MAGWMAAISSGAIGLYNLINPSVKRWMTYVVVGAAAVLWLRRDAVKSAEMEARLDEFESAANLRHSVRDDFDERVLKYSDNGYRD